nr:hypothetical protein [Tanacetum cinerariifolium]
MICILSGRYKPTTVLVQAVEETDDSSAIPEHTTPEWSRFAMIVKQQHKLDEVSYHKLFDILKQYQNEVTELRAERLARNANQLTLVATAQANQDPYYQTSRSHKSHAPSSKPSIPTRSHTTTRHKGKEIAKPITPPSETASEEDSDPEQAQRDGHAEEFGSHCKECKKLKRVKDSRYHKEKMLLCKQAEQGVPLQSEQYDWLADMDEEVDKQELEAHYSYMAKIQEVPTTDSGTDSETVEQVQNDAGYNVFANDLQHFEQSESVSNTCLVEMDDSNVIPDSPNIVRDSFLVALQTKQTEFEKYKAINDRTIDYDKLERVVLLVTSLNPWQNRSFIFNFHKELEAHYSYMAKIQEVLTADSGTDSEPVEQVQNDVGYNVLANDLQHYEQSESNDQNNVESDDERVALANLKLDVDENKRIQKQLKKANTTLAQELKECKSILAEIGKSLGESISVRDSCLVALQTKQTEFEKYKAFNDRTIDYDKLKRKLNETLGQLALKDIEIKEGLKTKAYEISVVIQKHDELMKQSFN